MCIRSWTVNNGPGPAVLKNKSPRVDRRKTLFEAMGTNRENFSVDVAAVGPVNIRQAFRFAELPSVRNISPAAKFAVGNRKNLFTCKAARGLAPFPVKSPIPMLLHCVRAGPKLELPNLFAKGPPKAH
jgi:hypothetical protein